MDRKRWHWIVSLVFFAIVLLVSLLYEPDDAPLTIQGEEALLERIAPVGVVMYPEDPSVLAESPATLPEPAADEQPRKPRTALQTTPAAKPVEAAVVAEAGSTGKAGRDTPVTADAVGVTARATVTDRQATAVQRDNKRQPVQRVSLRPQEAPMSGAEVYEHGCYVCHGPGLTGAPKIEDRREWRRRLRKGREQLYSNAINGFRGEAGPMPPKGGYTYLSDAEIKAAVNYMLRKKR